MVLSDNNNFDQKGGLAESPHHNYKSTPTSKTPLQRSWAQVVTKNRKSLLHSVNPSSMANIAPTTLNDAEGPSTSKTSIWRSGHGAGSVFVDMTGRKESKVEFLQLVAQQYPSRVGVLTQQVGSLKFAEVNFAPEDAALSDCLTTGITFADKSTILPCRALDPHMQVVSLRLSNLPFLNEQALLQGLNKSLRKYGEILDVGILLEPTTGTYMCTGYAVLNVASPSEIFEPLTHLIPWDEQRECGFYAVWNQMPVYCRYCHVVANCPKRKNKLTCWNCGIVGHIAAECPRDKPSKKARKQPEPPSKMLATMQQVTAPPEVVQNVVDTPVEVPEEPMEDLVELITNNDVSKSLDTPALLDVPTPTLNAEAASKLSVKRQKKDLRPTPYVLPTTRSKSTVTKAQPPTPEQVEYVDRQPSVNGTDHLASPSSGTLAGEDDYVTSLQ